ncbi:MAG TPA: DUF3040 domain-containing protein [Trebonia sp.]|nr:DUF3040 domain-containing protein [Trebonia sp.]
MSLPAHQQRVLDGIEISLEGDDPKLRSMFAIFTRLTRGEEVPVTERVRARARARSKAQAIMVAPILVVFVLGVVTLCIFLAVSTSTVRACKSVSQPRAATTRAVGCESLPPTWK